MDYDCLRDYLFDKALAELEREEKEQDAMCCRNCFHYNSPFCTYYDEECPEKEPTDYCGHFDKYEDCPTDRLEDLL